MYGSNIGKPIFSLSNTLEKISNGLNIVKKIIPLYENTKPLINDAKKILNSLNIKTVTKKNYPKQNSEIKPIKKEKTNNVNLVFFQ